MSHFHDIQSWKREFYKNWFSYFHNESFEDRNVPCYLLQFTTPWTSDTGDITGIFGTLAQ